MENMNLTIFEQIMKKWEHIFICFFLLNTFNVFFQKKEHFENLYSRCGAGGGTYMKHSPALLDGKIVPTQWNVGESTIFFRRKQKKTDLIYSLFFQKRHFLKTRTLAAAPGGIHTPAARRLD